MIACRRERVSLTLGGDASIGVLNVEFIGYLDLIWNNLTVRVDRPGISPNNLLSLATCGRRRGGVAS